MWTASPTILRVALAAALLLTVLGGRAACGEQGRGFSQVWVCSNLGHPHTPDEAIAACKAALEAPGGLGNATIADI